MEDTKLCLTHQRLRSTITATALAISAFLYINYKPLTQPSLKAEKQIKKLTAPYSELIARTTQKPPETKTIIDMETLKTSQK
jgi:hypothetical protein